MLEKGTGVYVSEWIVMDCGAVCHTARYTFGDRMFTSDGRRTGVVYGFFNTLFTLCRRYECTNFAFCWDSQASKRKEIYPEYKANRAKTPDVLEGYKQFDLIREEILPRLGITNSYWQEGYEADDLIASICRHNEGYKYIASTDHDLYQLLDEETCMVKHTATHAMKYTVEAFKEQYGIEPDEWPLVKAMAGCSTDNIKGIPSIAEKRAVLHLRGKYQSKCTGREAEKIINRNMKLVKLPMKGTKKIFLQEQPLIDVNVFVDICKEFEFKKFLVNIDLWEQLFAGCVPKRKLKLWDGNVKRESKMPSLGLV